MKRACHVVVDILRLIELQQADVIDQIMSIDGDLFLLGGDSVVSEVSHTKR